MKHVRKEVGVLEWSTNSFHTICLDLIGPLRDSHELSVSDVELAYGENLKLSNNHTLDIRSSFNYPGLLCLRKLTPLPPPTTRNR